MMKKLRIWYVMIVSLVLVFTSCEVNDEFDDCPDVTINIDNVPGSAVYRFAAQLEGIEDVQLTWSIDGEDVDTGNLNDIANQVFEYRFETGTYTICVKAADVDCPIEVCKEINVVVDDNNPCPDLFFEARQYEKPSHYKFIADFPGMEQTHFGWYINGELVEDTGIDDENYLFWEFKEPGSYEVCIKSETEECPNGTSYCKIIEIEEIDKDCPEIRFVKEIDPEVERGYIFEADIPEIDQVSEIRWYINGEIVENPTDSNEENRVLRRQFEPGKYEVCLKVITENCPDGVLFCKEIWVGEDKCPDLKFIAEQDGDNPAYYFQVEFEGADNYEWLGWFINGEFVDDSNFGDNNRFYYQFEPGVYEVCLKTETPDCPEGTFYCKVIEIEGDVAECPELFFEVEQEGDTSGYNFWASFDGIEDVSYEWMINGDVIDTEELGNESRDDYLYYQFGVGTYEICIIMETPNCPEGVMYCKALVIEE